MPPLASHDPEVIRQAWGQYIQQHLHTCGISQRQLAVLTGIDRSNLSRLSNGHLDGFALGALVRYAALLGMNVRPEAMVAAPAGLTWSTDAYQAAVTALGEEIARRGWSQRQAADFLNTPRPDLSNTLAGKARRSYRLDVLIGFLDQLGVQFYGAARPREEAELQPRRRSRRQTEAA